MGTSKRVAPLATTDPLHSVTLSFTQGVSGVVGTSDPESFSGTEGSDFLDGGGGNDTLQGLGGADTLVGGLGGDSLLGGDGNDTYVVDSAGDVIVETVTLASEIDTVRASVSWVLGANLENLLLTGTALLFGTGNGRANQITGNAVANILNGVAGNDTLDGAAGNDSLNGGAGADSLVGGRGNDTLTGGDGADRLVAGPGFDSLSGGLGNDRLVGGADNDTLLGGAGADTLDGGAGADRLVGGAGADLYVADYAGDVVIETAATDGGIDTVQAAVNWTLGAHVENLVLTGADVLLGSGNALANAITGNEAANGLFGLGGADTLRGGAGDDTLSGGDGRDDLAGGGGADAMEGGSSADTLDGGTGADTLEGGTGADRYVVDDALDVITEVVTDPAEIDTVVASVGWVLGENLDRLELQGAGGLAGTGNDLDNQIVGGEGPDTLDGRGGADTLEGGSGDDVYDGVERGDAVIEAADAGFDTVRTALDDYALGDGVEAVVYTGSASFVGTGNTLDNRLQGGAGRDALDGGVGADTLVGGEGDDVFLVDAVGDVVVELVSQGRDLVVAAIDWTLGPNLENLELGFVAVEGFGNDLDNGLSGNASDNLLVGLGGDDSMAGGPGSDTLEGGDGRDQLDGTDGLSVDSVDSLVGGAGNDLYRVGADDIVVEEPGASGGIDRVIAHASHTLADNVETLDLYGPAGEIDGTGNALDNLIVGNTYRNAISGREGRDTIEARGGNDTLDGGAGADSLVGGAGDDRYLVDDAGDVVVEAEGEGVQDIVDTTLQSYTLGPNVENLRYLGAPEVGFVGTGNELENALFGGDGPDTLDGGADTDEMNGGRGDDVYVVDAGLDLITEPAGFGKDEVRTALNTYFLAHQNVEHAEIEVLRFVGTGAFQGGAYRFAAEIHGGAGDDTLFGGVGADTLYGGDGHDQYRIDAADLIVEPEGPTGGDDIVEVRGGNYTLPANVERLKLADDPLATQATGNALGNQIFGNDHANVLRGVDGDDYLYGYGGDDHVFGGAGNDTLVGSGGADTLSGGSGNDLYSISSAATVVSESGTSLTEIDEVRATIDYTLPPNVERLSLTRSASGTGNDRANLVTGSAGADVLAGLAGDDTLRGSGGNDTLIGGSGRDSLDGGAGADRFVLDALDTDSVVGFISGTDQIAIDMSAVRIGNGSTAIADPLVRAAPGGWSGINELVIFTGNIFELSTGAASSGAGAATSNVAAGDSLIMVFDTGNSTGIFRFVSADGNATVAPAELTLLAVLHGTSATAIADYIFVA